MKTDALFPRSFSRPYPEAIRGEGVYIFDAAGKRYLDACGGAAVVSIGHGVREIAEAMAAQAVQLAYTHSSQFHTPVAEELAEFLRNKFPGCRVWFTSGGSEATETALKIARQYWLSRGQPERSKVIARRQSYHGTTLGALTVSGNQPRREPYLPLLAPFAEHIAPCFCHHCELDLTYPSCDLACADELEKAITENTAAFICEPIVGATTGAVPPDGYLRRIREICDDAGILWIADEILTGVGRTGTYFAVEHDGVMPDLMLLGKGLASGYAPLGAVLVAEHVWQAIAGASVAMNHGFTYQAHPPSLAAGLAVQRYIEKHDLIERARLRGHYLAARLESLRGLPGVSDVRGRGLFHSVEFTPAGQGQRIADLLLERGILVYAMPDHIMLAPPFIVEEKQLDSVVDAIIASIG